MARLTSPSDTCTGRVVVSRETTAADARVTRERIRTVDAHVAGATPACYRRRPPRGRAIRIVFRAIRGSRAANSSSQRAKARGPGWATRRSKSSSAACMPTSRPGGLAHDPLVVAEVHEHIAGRASRKEPPEHALEVRVLDRGHVHARVPLARRAAKRTASALPRDVRDPALQLRVLSDLVQHDRRDAGALLEQQALARDDVLRPPGLGQVHRHIGVDFRGAGELAPPRPGDGRPRRSTRAPIR